jgi:hypothetical protein
MFRIDRLPFSLLRADDTAKGASPAPAQNTPSDDIKSRFNLTLNNFLK